MLTRITWKMNKHFPDPLIGKFIGKNQWAVLNDFRYHSPKYMTITVPKGFVSDGASIPSVLWGIIGSPWSGRFPSAAIIHDYLYFSQRFTRAQSDEIFLEGMQLLGVNLFKRRLMFAAVRVFGWLCWKKRKEK